MLASAIITYREILEICLIIGIISAALENLESRKRILSIGIIGGIALSSIIAFFINYISGSFDDNGQEILNILILSISILCIGITIVWINKNAKDLNHKITIAKQRLINNEINSLALILIIILAISREGAELILFLHGVYASGSSLSDMATGVSIGAVIGMSIGIALYAGLVKLPMKYFFKVINVMLVLLAAGMASQLANLLTSADLISVLYTQVWDSSWLIDEGDTAGKILYSLMGYSAKPTQLQLIFYISTIIIISLLVYFPSLQKSLKTNIVN